MLHSRERETHSDFEVLKKKKKKKVWVNRRKK